MRRALALAALLAAAPAAAASPRLVLIGGGERPPQAMERFVAWSGGAQSRLVVIPWASADAPETGVDLVKEFQAFHPAAAESVASTVTVRADPAAFERLLSSATGVYFSGGDQVRLMAAVQSVGLLERFRAMAAAGVAFAGTSAGTAVMSDPMITGEGDFTKLDSAHVETATGLGLLPGVIVDQHFLRRQRENRLFGLLLAHPDRLGLGIDEGNALLVDGTVGEVVGPTAVMAVRVEGPDRFSVELVRPGRRYDLAGRRLLPQ